MTNRELLDQAEEVAYYGKRLARDADFEDDEKQERITERVNTTLNNPEEQVKVMREEINRRLGFK